MSRKYEISVWNDIYDEELGRFKEEKLIIIGSDTMTSLARARSPQLVNNINGTNTFTFILYYSYIDPETGDSIKNPYVSFLVNERKVKVFWKDKWYDLLVKDIKEDSHNHTFTYTCQDQYLTELSRTGFELEFNTELENNIGTAPELIERTIEGTDWQLMEGDTIYQKIEEPVYEVQVLNDFIAQTNPKLEDINIVSGASALIYYSCAPDKDNLKTFLQFYYNGTTTWQQDENDMLVINGHCYSVNVTWDVSENRAAALYDGAKIFEINFDIGLSKNFRAERYVQSQKTVYNDIVGRYVNVYNDGELLGFSSTEYNDATAVVNLIANPSNFSNASGWIGTESIFRLYPGFDENTDITQYAATSYLRFSSEDTYLYNSGLQNNRAYIQNGFIEGETYICRIRAKAGTSDTPNGSRLIGPNLFTPIISDRASGEYTPSGDRYFEIIESKYDEENDWLEYKMSCVKSRSYESLISSLNPFGFFLSKAASSVYWLEEVQFFKEIYGNSGYDTEQIRINPGEMNLQSIAQETWKYFNANQPEGTTKDSLEYVYTSLNEWNEATPVYNNFEKYGTIEESNSNRFNILQTIAETFQGWIRFIINHDENGYVLYDDDGRPEKYVQFVEQVGEEKGVNFIYGVDLKAVQRRVDSSSISTKTIVLQNENEFGENGFCSIARSTQNYPRENFIYNFDYFVQQGLLDGDALNNDLYNTNESISLAYYPNLHRLNTEYAKNLENLLNKKQELTRQNATATVYNQYISSAQEELGSVESDIIKLAGVSTIDEAKTYLQSHWNFTKVTTLLNDRETIKNLIAIYKDLLTSINNSIVALQTEIDRINARQSEIITELLQRNKAFYDKYSRFIQEGTWTSEDYYNDDLYYLDALQVAYTSSRPKVTYTIDILRLSDIEEYSTKIFNLGDICTIQDTEYFGYLSDHITPYKEQVLITEITSYFDTPDKDTFKVQNYQNQFDDLFQRITAATQNLEFSSGKYARAANIINSDGTIKSSVIQNTFESNKDLVYGAQNESATMDNTGITVTSYDDGSKQVKITSGGLFVTSDGGATWKNAIRGDGITADVLTAGKINTESITIYNGDYPGFLWDPTGINAYKFNDTGQVDLSNFVRFDQFGIYGVKGNTDFKPTSEEQIYQNSNFGLTWNRFFLKNNSANGSIEISSDEDILIKSNDIDRIQIGRLGYLDGLENYGIIIRDPEGNIVFKSDIEGAQIAGWTINQNYLQSSYDQAGNSIRINSDGSIGCYAHEALEENEGCYTVVLTNSVTAVRIKDNTSITIPSNSTIYLFSSFIGSRTTIYTNNANYSPTYDTLPSRDSTYNPKLETTLQFYYNGDTYSIILNSWDYSYVANHSTNSYNVSTGTVEYTTLYTYDFTCNAIQDNKNVFSLSANASVNTTQPRYYPASTTRWAIANSGEAEFFNIQAKGGTIAGWTIDEEKIYSTKTGTVLSSSGSAKSGGTDYSIVTDAINAAMASLGGVIMSGGLINGYSLAKIYQATNNAYNRANQAYNLAVGIDTSTATSKAQQAYNLASQVQANFRNHTHTLRAGQQYIFQNASLSNGRFTGVLQAEPVTRGPNY